MLGLCRSGNWNENNLNPLSSINWRASLAPAAMVIPAPIAYIKVVAVKKLVVGFRNGPVGPPALQLAGVLLAGLFFFAKTARSLRCARAGLATFTLKKLECSKQARRLNT